MRRGGLDRANGCGLRLLSQLEGCDALNPYPQALRGIQFFTDVSYWGRNYRRLRFEPIALRPG